MTTKANEQSVCQMEKLKKWYCLDQGGNMKYVGEFASFEDADDSMEYSCVWLVDEEIARTWLSQHQGMLSSTNGAAT